MKASTWTAGTLLCFVMGCGLIIASSCALDTFGIFRNPSGKHLSVQYNERTAKVFLNERYVPANFDALLIGGSSTSNWPMSSLDFAHFYNESLYGSNTVEEKRLVDEALQTGHFRYAICVINPYMLQSHNLNESSGRSPRLEALGSVNLLREEFFGLLHRLRGTRSAFTPDGGQAMPPSKNEADPYTAYSFTYDPIALEALRQTLEELRSRGVRLIFLQTPVYESVYEKHRAQFDSFYAAFPLRRPGEPLIDFDAPQYASFRSDPTRWVDPPHLNDASAVLASSELNRAIHATIPGLPTSAKQ